MYREFSPKKHLSHIIDKFWIFQNTKKNYTSYILPDCSMDFIFNFGDSFYEKNKISKINHNDILLIGIMTTFLRSTYSSNTKLFGVRFKPLGMNYFLNLNFNIVKNEKILVKSLLPQNQYSLLEYIFSYNKIDDIIDYFEKVLCYLININNCTIDINTIQILKNINHNKNNTIQNIIADIYISQRQLEIKFKRDIGISMKEFININRFIKAKKQISNSKKTLTEIALDNGYYDSSHFIKEIKKYSGVSPKLLK